jgi:hypothetical protein
MFYYQSPDVVRVTGHELPWLFTSGFQDTKPLQFQLQEKDHPAANYSVTLYFAELKDVRAGQRRFNVLLQGKPVLTEFDVREAADGIRRALTRKFNHVSVTQSLTIALQSAGSQLPPVLSAIAIERE